MTFKNEKGLTLIELLITIAVIAIVAAISIPVITNVIESSRTSSAGSMEAQVNAFIEKYAESGEVAYDAATQTFTGFVDLDGNGVISNPAEIIETFTVDAGQFSVTVDSATAPTSATVTAGGGTTGGATQTAGVTIYPGAALTSEEPQRQWAYMTARDTEPWQGYLFMNAVSLADVQAAANAIDAGATTVTVGGYTGTIVNGDPGQWPNTSEKYTFSENSYYGGYDMSIFVDFSANRTLQPTWNGFEMGEPYTLQFSVSWGPGSGSSGNPEWAPVTIQ
jgi:type IV pilus assembly protein PilA